MAREKDIQSDIMDYLTSINASVTKYNVNGFGRKGEPDLFASVIHSGYKYPIALYIEVKDPDGEESTIQRIKRERRTEAGHLSIVADSVSVVRDFINSL